MKMTRFLNVLNQFPTLELLQYWPIMIPMRSWTSMRVYASPATPSSHTEYYCQKLCQVALPSDSNSRIQCYRPYRPTLQSYLDQQRTAPLIFRTSLGHPLPPAQRPLKLAQNQQDRRKPSCSLGWTGIWVLSRHHYKLVSILPLFTLRIGQLSSAKFVFHFIKTP